MNLILNLSSNKLDDEDLQALTRELCNQIQSEADMKAGLPSQEGENSKGAVIELGKIVLSNRNLDY